MEAIFIIYFIFLVFIYKDIFIELLKPWGEFLEWMEESVAIIFEDYEMVTYIAMAFFTGGVIATITASTVEIAMGYLLFTMIFFVVFLKYYRKWKKIKVD